MRWEGRESVQGWEGTKVACRESVGGGKREESKIIQTLKGVLFLYGTNTLFESKPQKNTKC